MKKGKNRFVYIFIIGIFSFIGKAIADDMFQSDGAMIGFSRPGLTYQMRISDNVNTFTGKLELSIELFTLHDRGIRFPITLRYNSDIKNIVLTDNTKGQVSFVGMGFNIDIPKIIPDEAVIVYDESMSVGRYYRTAGTGVYVANGAISKYKTTNLGKTFCNYRYWKIPEAYNQQWKIIDESGILYSFAHTAKRLYRFLGYKKLANADPPTIKLWPEGYAQYNKLPYCYFLSKIEDAWGNGIHFSYRNIQEYISDYRYLNREPLDKSDEIVRNYATYDKATYLDKIEANGTGMYAKFYWEARTDVYDGSVDNGRAHLLDDTENGDNYQEYFFKERLWGIRIFNRNHVCLKVIRFVYDYHHYGTENSAKYSKMVLRYLKELNPANEDQILSTYEFKYTEKGEKSQGALSEIIYPGGFTKKFIITTMNFSNMNTLEKEIIVWKVFLLGTVLMPSH